MRRVDPLAERSKRALAEALRPFLPASGLVLELGSGSGVHALHLATTYPWLEWQPSDVEPGALASIAAWREEGPPSLRPPIALDATRPPWPIARAEAILASHVLHCLDGREAALREARRVLAPGGRLLLHGPLGEGGAIDVAAGSRALRGSAFCPVTRIPARAEVLAEAAAAGLAVEAALEVEGVPLLVLGAMG